MRALVTGADGLLGSHLVRELLERDISVRALVLPNSISPVLDGLRIELMKADLLNAPAVAEAASGCGVVFHCAAITDIKAEPDLVWRVNLDGTRNVLDACLKNSVGRLIHVGSASSFQFGTMEDPGDEAGPFPRAYKKMPYMESKYKAMELVQEYVRDRGLDAVMVAPTFMLGAYDFRPSSGELIRQFIVRGLRFTSPGGRNFAFAPDVAGALVLAAERGKTGRCYIAGGCNMSYFDFFSRVAGIAGVRPPSLVLPGPLVMAGGAFGSLWGAISRTQAAINLTIARLSLYGTYYSSSRAIDELGMAQTPIETGIEQSIRSLRDYGHIA